MRNHLGTLVGGGVLWAIASSANADDYFWSYSFSPNVKYPNVQSACTAATQYFSAANGWKWISGEFYEYIYPYTGQCTSTFINQSGQLVTNHGYNGYKIYKGGTGCTNQKSYNPSTGACGFDEQKGLPQPMACVGNPVNLAIGNKYERSYDYKSPKGDLNFSRYYNSIDGEWRHGYSTRLRFAGSQYASLIGSDGKESFFTISGSTITPASSDLGLLIKIPTGWRYLSTSNERFTFDSAGNLTDWSDLQGNSQYLAYSGSQVTVTDNIGNSLSFTEDANHQPLTLSAPGMQVAYGYDANNHLISIARTIDGVTTQRKMLYEDPRSARLLTGILDENGERFASWAYDDQGRAISSEHANGAEKVTLAYNTDGSTTVTNEYGKKATYRFQLIQGVRQIVAIEGSPTPNCPNSNSTFTYDTRGLLKTKIDNKGHLTTYEYNDRGLEVSRTEAAGTPQARTITTQWHPTLFLKTQITEPERVIRYQYDEQGRQTGQTVTPL